MKVLAQHDRPTPPWVASQLVKFGTNPYGQPLYKIVWSESELEFVLLANGKYGWQPRYPDTKRWLLVKWLPTSYSREQWHALFAMPVSDDFTGQAMGRCILGPYLEHGDYHCSYRLEFRGQFMPLTMAVVEYYARLIEAGRETTAAQRRFAQEQRVAKAKREWEQRCDDVFDDAQPAFGVQSIMTGYGAKTSRVKPEDVSLASVDRLPAWVPRKPGFSQF